MFLHTVIFRPFSETTVCVRFPFLRRRYETKVKAVSGIKCLCRPQTSLAVASGLHSGELQSACGEKHEVFNHPWRISVGTPSEVHILCQLFCRPGQCLKRPKLGNPLCRDSRCSQPLPYSPGIFLPPSGQHRGQGRDLKEARCILDLLHIHH